MKNYLLLFFLLCSSCLWGQDIRPNIVFFMVDDLGWQDTSEPFWVEQTPSNRKYHTPNMERLAREGVKFSNAYATPVCTPSRVSLITGMNAARHRVTNWTHPIKEINTDEGSEQFEKVAWNLNGLSPEPNMPRTVQASPLPQLLKDAGYFTIHAGKAHWGGMGTPGSDPKNLGFVVNIAGNSSGHPESYHGKDNYGNLKPGKGFPNAVTDMEAYFWSEIFLTEALTREALKALEFPVKNRQPFFLYLSHYAVHTPIMADSNYVQKYIDRGLSPTDARYASLIEGMDKSLGDVLNYLEKNNLSKNTIIVFMSDNGGLNNEPIRGPSSLGWNAPLRHGKGAVYEGGIREPMMVKWPGITKAGTVAESPVIIEDFFPTLLEMADVQPTNLIQKVDGHSFVPVLKNTETKMLERPIVWYFPHNRSETDLEQNYLGAMRKGDYKLVWHMNTSKLELYDLKSDIGEHIDLSHKMPQKVKELANEMTEVLIERKAQRLKRAQNGAYVPWPNGEM